MHLVFAVLSMLFLSAYKMIYKQLTNEGSRSENIFINTFLFCGILKIIIVFLVPGYHFEFRWERMLQYIPDVLCDVIASYLYIKAVKRIPISIAAPLYLAYYPLSVILSITIFHESVLLSQILAMIVIGILILVLSITTSKDRLNKGMEKEHLSSIPKGISNQLNSISKGILFALIAGIFNGLYIFLDKLWLNHGMFPEEQILYGGIGSIMVSFVFYFRLKRVGIRGREYHYTLTPLLLIAIALRFLSSISYTAAMATGEASTVIPIAASDVIVIAALSSIFLKEKLKWYQILSIIAFVICIIILTI